MCIITLYYFSLYIRYPKIAIKFLTSLVLGSLNFLELSKFGHSGILASRAIIIVSDLSKRVNLGKRSDSSSCLHVYLMDNRKLAEVSRNMVKGTEFVSKWPSYYKFCLPLASMKKSRCSVKRLHLYL